MKAVMSPRHRIAWLLQDAKVHAIVRPDEIERISSPLEELAYWLNSCTDCVFIERAEASEVQRDLRLNASVEEAVQLFLMFVNHSVRRSTRRQIAADIEGLLDSIEVRERWCWFFSSSVMPDASELDDWIKLAGESGAYEFQKLLSELKMVQPAIKQAVITWERIPIHEFGSGDLRSAARERFVKAGLFGRSHSPLLPVPVYRHSHSLNLKLRLSNQIGKIATYWFVGFAH